MPTGIPPKYIGRLTVTASSNDRITWHEQDDMAHSYDLTATLTAGTYYPDALAAEMKTQMEAVSAASGLGLDYGGTGCTFTFAFSNLGILTITIDHATANVLWYPKITATETRKVLPGIGAAVGSWGRQHLGFYVDASYPSAAVSHSGDIAHGNSWFPSEPRSGSVGDDEGQPDSTAAEFVSWGGDVQAYDFSGDSAIDLSYLDVRSVGYEQLADADRTQYRDEFWLPYAKQGLPDGRFRFYEDRTSSSYYEMGLTQDSLKRAQFSRFRNLPRWDFSHMMRRYKA